MAGSEDNSGRGTTRSMKAFGFSTGESLLSRAADQGSRLFACEFGRRQAPWRWPLL